MLLKPIGRPAPWPAALLHQPARSRWRRTVWLAALLLSSGPAWAQSGAPPVESVLVAGKKMASQSAGLATRKPGEPVVVFEGGVGAGLENFTPLWPALTAAGVPWLAYARTGMPGSEADPAVRTDRQVVERLHALLQARRVPPPYLLVGHSLGGPLVRLFAALYPTEVAGLVLIDPTNFLLTPAADEQIRAQSGSALGYQKTFVTMLGKQAADPGIPAGVRADMQRAADANRAEYFPGYRTLPALPPVPVRVLLAYNSPVEGGEAELARELGLKQPAWFAQVNQRRMLDFAELIQRNPHSAVTLLPGYVHVIHHMDPALVTRTIQEVHQQALAARKLPPALARLRRARPRAVWVKGPAGADGRRSRRGAAAARHSRASARTTFHVWCVCGGQQRVVWQFHERRKDA